MARALRLARPPPPTPPPTRKFFAWIYYCNLFSRDACRASSSEKYPRDVIDGTEDGNGRARQMKLVKSPSGALRCAWNLGCPARQASRVHVCWAWGLRSLLSSNHSLPILPGNRWSDQRVAATTRDAAHKLTIARCPPRMQRHATEPRRAARVAEETPASCAIPECEALASTVLARRVPVSGTIPGAPTDAGSDGATALTVDKRGYVYWATRGCIYQCVDNGPAARECHAEPDEGSGPVLVFKRDVGEINYVHLRLAGGCACRPCDEKSGCILGQCFPINALPLALLPIVRMQPARPPLSCRADHRKAVAD